VTQETADLDEEEPQGADLVFQPTEEDKNDPWAMNMLECIRKYERTAPATAAAIKAAQRSRDEVILSIRDNVQVIGDMLVDLSKRLEAIEASVASGGTRARDVWARRTSGGEEASGTLG